MQTIHFQRKRALYTALLVLMLNVAGMGKSYAQTTFTVSNLNYSVNSDGTSVTVTGHVDGTAATGSLVIPESVNYQGTTYPVIKIDVAAFMGCNSLTSLVLPNSVIEIDHHAFAFCSGFTGDLVLPNSLTTIG